MKAAFEELFGHVRLGFLTRDCLEDVVAIELVRESLACVKLVMCEADHGYYLCTV